MTTIYTVHGERGEYSDWTTWLVAGHYVKDDAEQHAKRLNEIVAVFLSDIKACDYDWEAEYAVEKKARAALVEAGEGESTSYMSSTYPPSYSVGELKVLGDRK